MSTEFIQLMLFIISNEVEQTQANCYLENLSFVKVKQYSCNIENFYRKTTLTSRMIFGQADGMMFVESELSNKQVEQLLGF